MLMPQPKPMLMQAAVQTIFLYIRKDELTMDFRSACEICVAFSVFPVCMPILSCLPEQSMDLVKFTNLNRSCAGWSEFALSISILSYSTCYSLCTMLQKSFYHAFAAKFHLLRGYDDIDCFHVTIELPLHECNYTMPLEVISEGDWLHTDFGRQSNTDWLNDLFITH